MCYLCVALIAVFVMGSVKNILIAICAIGIIGAIAIYIAEYRDKKK